MATGPDLRIGHAEREATAARLRDNYAQGRLTLEEFQERLDAAFAATRQSDLEALTRDLPPSAAPAPPVPLTAPAQERTGRGPGPRARLGMIPVVAAALVTWLIVADLQLRGFAWPGRLAVFLAIFAGIRWLMRRLWRFGRGGGPMGCGRYRGRR